MLETSSGSRSALRHAAASRPDSFSSIATASVTVCGRARSHFCSGSEKVIPNLVSTHTRADGPVAPASEIRRESSASIAGPSVFFIFLSTALLVTRSRVSTMTLVSGIVTANSFDATFYNGPVLFFLRTFARHRSGRSDALKSVWCQSFTHATDQQRHIGPLSTAIGMQLVQHQKAQSGAVSNHPSIQVILTGHQEFEHHEVGQQNIGRTVGNRLALLSGFLSGVARKCNRIARTFSTYFASSSR